MNNISGLIVRVVFSVIVVFIISKMISPYFQKFIERITAPKKKNSSDDFDNLVARSKRELQLSNRITGTATNSKNRPADNKTSNKTVEKYLKSHDPNVVKLFESSLWGAGQEYKAIQEEIKRKYKIDTEIDQVTTSFNKIIKDNLLLKINRNDLASFEEIKTLIGNFAIIHGLVAEIPHGRGKTINGLSKDGINRENLIQSSLSLFLSLQKIKPILVYKHLLDERIVASNPFMGIGSGDIILSATDILLSKGNKKITTIPELISKLTEKVDIFLALAYIPNPKEVPVKKLYQIFNATPDTDINTIKAKYKAIAKAIHPDTLHAQNIPDEIKNRANENFANLQAAYKRITGE